MTTETWLYHFTTLFLILFIKFVFIFIVFVFIKERTVIKCETNKQTNKKRQLRMSSQDRVQHIMMVKKETTLHIIYYYILYYININIIEGGLPWLRGHRHLTESKDLRLWDQSPATHASNFQTLDWKKSTRHPTKKITVFRRYFL